MKSHSGWTARNGVENTKTCGIPIFRSRILKLGRSWLRAYMQLLCSVDASKVKCGEKLDMHMVETLASHSR